MCKKLSLGLIFTLVLFVATLVFPFTSFAFEKPHVYYDWNNYQKDRVLGLKVYAQEESTPSAISQQEDFKDIRQYDYRMGFAKDYLPGDPFYFLKRAEEGLTLAFTLNAENRERVRMQFAGERLSELETLVDTGDTKRIESLAKDYKDTVGLVSLNLKRLKNSGENIGGLINEIDTESAKHTLILEELSFEVAQNLEEGIKAALEASEEAIDTVSDFQGLPSLPQAVINRLQALKAQGLLTEEEVNKLVNVSTRRDAREELRKYVKARLLPEADYMKLSETAMNNFPQAYFNILEIKKFIELKDLETEQPTQEIIEQVQEYAKEYEPGDVIPSEIKRWWIPLVRLEELQNTIRLDLIDENLFRNRPEDYQKYLEIVERAKPTDEDIEYINSLIERNPNVLNDPSYARLKAMADKFGTVESGLRRDSDVRCLTGEHWVDVSFMPNGGYCMPNYEFPTIEGFEEESCPPGYHRPEIGASCYPDSPNADISKIRKSQDCPAGYTWVKDVFGGFCEPNFVTDGGPFPQPVYSPAYCPPGQIFRDEGCAEYKPVPSEGCLEGSFWNGDECVVKGDEGFGDCSQPTWGCGEGYWDEVICNCVYPGSPKDNTGSDYTGLKEACDSWPDCTWNGSACDCPGSTKTELPSSSESQGDSLPSGSTDCTPQDCPSGSTWDSGSCTCHFPPSDDSSGGESPDGGCAPPVEGCPAGQSWDSGSCSCK